MTCRPSFLSLLHSIAYVPSFISMSTSRSATVATVTFYGVFAILLLAAAANELLVAQQEALLLVASKEAESKREREDDEKRRQEKLEKEQDEREGLRQEKLRKEREEQEKRQQEKLKREEERRRQEKLRRKREKEERRLHKKLMKERMTRERNDRIQNCVPRKLYHQTSRDRAERIQSDGRMSRGSSGYAGGGIYFGTTKQDTSKKSRRSGCMIVCDVKLGNVKRISSRDSSITYTSLLMEGYDSVEIHRTTGIEYAVYNSDQVKNRKVNKKRMWQKW